MSTPTPTLTGAYTCTHHNDRERAACPVCLVTTLTAERDQLRAELAAEREKVTMLLSDAYALTKNWHDRAERAEADAAAYLKRAESFSKLADEAEAEAERYRLVTLRQDAELAAEREKLDWVFQNCKVEANDYTTGNLDVYYVHDREDLGAIVKEDAK